MSHKKIFFEQFLMLSFAYFSSSSIAYSDQNDLLELSVEDLLNVEVISVSKKAKSLNDSPAAIFVISQDDIKRIGATSVPEALRLAPGIDVARIDANKWAISARGFNGRFANKLLVLIDGRSIYTGAFSGVYWENQDVMLEDVERIEVIRGPGATLWGANAVNGVINIITKHSSDTQGGLVVAGGGTEEQAFGAFRYGAQLNSDTTARAYVKGFKRDENTHQSGGEAGDDWDKVQGGFRLDSQLSSQDNLSVQGDAYRTELNQNTTLPQLSPPYLNNFNETIDTFGGNLLARHQHTFSSTSDYTLQVFYEFYERNETFIRESRHVADIDFQHRFALLDWNDIVWGAGYRYNHDDFSTPTTINHVAPSSRNDQIFSAFVQDEITLIDDNLWLTVGSKFEHNDYSGFEAQPTARLMWTLHHQHRLWGAVSRAVRTPSRLEHTMNSVQAVTPPQPPFIPAVVVSLQGKEHFDSEQVISYEIGYRTTFINNLSIDFTAFYNNYKGLRSGEIGSIIPPSNLTDPATVSLNIGNNISAKTYGFEISTVWQMLEWWRWDASYSLLKTEYNKQDAVNDLGMSPQQRLSLRSAMSPWKNIELDLLFRYVDTNSAVSFTGLTVIKDYVSMDIRLAWQAMKDLELSLVGQNLLAEKHLEYRQELLTTPTEIDRGMYGKLTWRF